VDLPSFLWLWKIAAWSMGLTLLAYSFLAVSGGTLLWRRQQRQARPTWLRPIHLGLGVTLVVLVLLLLTIGLVGTYGHYGSLGHSPHLIMGLSVVVLVLLSAISAMQIHPQRTWARPLHLGTNIVLLLGLVLVGWTGWDVVQKYLP
jgi:hypothetical protein